MMVSSNADVFRPGQTEQFTLWRQYEERHRNLLQSGMVLSDSWFNSICIAEGIALQPSVAREAIQQCNKSHFQITTR